VVLGNEPVVVEMQRMIVIVVDNPSGTGKFSLNLNYKIADYMGQWTES
jgi:hypothetical protein